MRIIYDLETLNTLKERLDKENISNNIDNSAIMINLEQRGSTIFIGSHRSFMIIDNPVLEGLNIESIIIDNVLFNKKSISKNYLLFSINKNNKEIYDNYNNLATVYYKLDYEVKCIKAIREEFELI